MQDVSYNHAICVIQARKMCFTMLSEDDNTGRSEACIGNFRNRLLQSRTTYWSAAQPSGDDVGCFCVHQCWIIELETTFVANLRRTSGHSCISHHLLQFRNLKLPAIVNIQIRYNNSDGGKCAMPFVTLTFFDTATQNEGAVSTTSNLWLWVATNRLARHMSARLSQQCAIAACLN